MAFRASISPARHALCWIGALALTTATACGSSGQPILDKQEQLARFDWWDNRDSDWFAQRIPFLETPDPEIDATYYYRWELLTKHLVYGSVEHGYTFTEFIDRPFWSGTYGSISCPLGHQFYEVRWLKDRRIIEDFARYWFETPGAQPRSYSNWYADAMWATYQVLGDREFIVAVLPYMQRQYTGWMQERWDPEHRMFRWDGMHDGMETNIDSRQTPQWFDGAQGYRPTLNSYLYADAIAISKAAAVAGDADTSRRYAARAAELKGRVQQELWDPEREFFFQQFARDEETVNDPWPGATGDRAGDAAIGGARVPTEPGAPIRAKSLTYQTGPWAGSPYGRGQIGFVPWQFNLPDPGFESAWKFLMDPERFYAPYGPTTTERNDPLYHVSPRCCAWSGNSWPYATSQTLTALANLLNNYDQPYVDSEDYSELLRIYARTQRKDGRPYIAEAADPMTGSWAGHDKFFHSEHYLHSTFVDLVITGLIGLRPRDDDVLEINPLVPKDWDFFALDEVQYRGHRLAIVWDRDGSRYGRGAGLRVFLNGELLGEAERIEPLELELPAAAPVAAERRANYAVNNGKQWYPRASASSFQPQAPPSWAVDGQYWYHAAPPNRWVPIGADRSTWFEVDFGQARPIDTVKLYFLDDTDAGPDPVAEDPPMWLLSKAQEPTGRAAQALPVVAPVSYRLMVSNGSEWIDIPAQQRWPRIPAGRRANVVTFPSIQVEVVRLQIVSGPGTVSGLSEIETWGPETAPAPEPIRPVANLAFNPTGEGFPRVSASFDGDVPVTVVNDGESAFNNYSRKRWTAAGTANERDWIEVDFGGSRTVSGVDLHLWGWESRGTAAPLEWSVDSWNGASWISVPDIHWAPVRPLAMAVNTARFSPLNTSKIRVILRHASPRASAVSEIVVWGGEAGQPR